MLKPAWSQRQNRENFLRENHNKKRVDIVKGVRLKENLVDWHLKVPPKSTSTEYPRNGYRDELHAKDGFCRGSSRSSLNQNA